MTVRGWSRAVMALIVAGGFALGAGLAWLVGKAIGHIPPPTPRFHP